MSYKTVLSVIGTEQDEGEVKSSIALAQAMEAHLVVLVIGIAPIPPSSPYGVVNTDVWVQEADEGREASKARADKIEQQLVKAGLSGSVVSRYLDHGSIAAYVARAARYSDLTLVHAKSKGMESFWRSVLNGALFESARPILLVPKGKTAFPASKCAIIAWDASLEASKAVHDALPVLKAAKSVHAVLIDPVPSFDGHGDEPGADLGAYLARHGISIEVHKLPREGQEVGDIINRFITDKGGDLVVMGGYAHSRLRQLIFGGTTSTIMEDCPVPVLMSH